MNPSVVTFGEPREGMEVVVFQEDEVLGVVDASGCEIEEEEEE